MGSSNGYVRTMVWNFGASIDIGKSILVLESAISAISSRRIGDIRYHFDYAGSHWFMGQKYRDQVIFQTLVRML